MDFFQLRAMDVEFRTMVSSDKKSASSKVIHYRDEVRKATAYLRTLKDSVNLSYLKSESEQSRKTAMNRKKGENHINTKIDNSLNNATQALENSRKLVANSEDIGTNILLTLEDQREKFDQVESQLKGTKSTADRARRILRSMAIKALLNKFFLYIVIVFLAFLISVCAYLKATK